MNRWKAGFGASLLSGPALLVLLLTAACAAPAAEGPDRPFGRTVSTRKGTRALRAGFGTTLDPGSALLALGLQYAPTDHFALAPEVHLGVEDDLFLVAPTLSLKNTFHPPLEVLRGWLAHVEGGAGFAYLDRDGAGGGDDDDTAFLLTAGAGLEWPLEEDVTLVSNFRGWWAPGGILGEHTWFTWEVLGLKFYF